MIPAVELAKETQTKVFVYFPPNHYSSNLAVMGNGTPIQMQRYEARFKKALLPDEIVLTNGFHLSMPEKWKKNRQTEKKTERIQQLQLIMESLKQDGFEGFKPIGEQWTEI